MSESILIVDDERDIVDVLKTGLERSGFETVAYSDPMLALEHFSKHSGEYCLAVTDIRMPSINGFDLARQFHTINPKIKKVLMSAFEIHKNEVEKVLPTVVVDDFVTKPITIKELKAVILKHIANTKAIPDSVDPA